jgi:discoidin domain receptor family protein 2
MLECWRRDEIDRPAFREIHLFLQRKTIGYDPNQL